MAHIIAGLIEQDVVLRALAKRRRSKRGPQERRVYSGVGHGVDVHCSCPDPCSHKERLVQVPICILIEDGDQGIVRVCQALEK